MALQRSDTKLLLLAAGAVIVAGVLVAAVLLLATSRAGSPTKYTAFPAGDATAIHSELKKGGPFFYPDPFGGDRNILLALEDGKVVALDDIKPGTKDVPGAVAGLDQLVRRLPRRQGAEHRPRPLPVGDRGARQQQG